MTQSVTRYKLNHFPSLKCIDETDPRLFLCGRVVKSIHRIEAPSKRQASCSESNSKLSLESVDERQKIGGSRQNYNSDGQEMTRAQETDRRAAYKPRTDRT